MDDSGACLGYGYVRFETPDAASESVAQMNGVRLWGKVIYVGHLLPNLEQIEAVQRMVLSTYCQVSTFKKTRPMRPGAWSVTVPQSCHGQV